MRKRILGQLAATAMLVVLMAGSILADTLYLRNGSVLKGTFVGFENGEFVFQITSGDGRAPGRTVRFPTRDVLKLTLDREGTTGGGTGTDDRGYPTRPGGGGGNTGGGNTGGGTSGGRWTSHPPFDVRLEEQWVRTQIEVRSGQRVRADASGTIYLDGRTQTGPDGLSGKRDEDAPMPNQNDGALIGVIGQDPNAPPILIGRSREFTADRDGVLYFTVNHWETRDARGSYQVRVQVEGGSGTGNTGGGNTGRPSQGKDRSFTVFANQPWFDTGIDVEPGMSFNITAEGSIEILSRRSTGPDGDLNAQASGSRYPVPNEGVGALLMKVRYRNGGDSQILFVGRGKTVGIEQGENGRLFLGINDDFFGDNKGNFTVRVRW